MVLNHLKEAVAPNHLFIGKIKFDFWVKGNWQSFPEVRLVSKRP